MKKLIIWFASVLFLVLSFSSAAFTNFFISVDKTSFSLASLESDSSKVTVSFSDVLPQSDNQQPYKISMSEVCNEYDDDWNCLDAEPDLCPYVSIQPKDGESEQVGVFANYFSAWRFAKGELSNSEDLIDEWTVSIDAPCFEGECPSTYNNEFGSPLPQSLKNKKFACDLGVYWNGGIFQVRGLANTAYAGESLVRVEAVFTGISEPQINPVIVVPGIMGSAYKDGNWVIDPVFHVYDNLIETLEKNGYIVGENLFPWGYDWKKSNVQNALLLKQKINQIKSICDCSQVDVVAHSMGGLVTRSYVQSVDYGNDIDQIIFLGTPHRGAVNDYFMWEAGEFSPGTLSFLLNFHFKKEAKEYGYNNIFDYVRGWPVKTVEELLPTSNYLYSATTSQNLVYPIGYPENNFIENLNQGLVGFLESDIDITNILSETENTIVGLRIVDSDKFPLWQHGYPENYDLDQGDRGLVLGAGDGTVPKESASLGENIDLVIESSHMSLPTDAMEEIFSEIHGGELEEKVKTALPLKILFAKIFSPADFVLIAPDGKRVGKDFATGQEINEISGAFYSGFEGDDEYVTIPDPIEGEYKIELQGTGNGGVYSFETTFISEATSTTSEVSGVTAPNQITQLSLGIDNQGFDQNQLQKQVTLDVLISDINLSYDLGWINDSKTKDDLIRKAKLLIKFEKRSSGKYEEVVDMQLIKVADKEVDKLFEKAKINQQAKDLLKKDLQYIINNN